MNIRRSLVLQLCSALVLAGCMFLLVSDLPGAQPPPQNHRIAIRKMQNKWRAVHDEDSTQTTVHAKRGEHVSWKSYGTEMYIQFMSDSLFGTYTAVVKQGKSIDLTVLPNAPKGEYKYAVFCLPDKEYATGNSPPVIIID
jgi:hypothetical protein